MKTYTIEQVIELYRAYYKYVDNLQMLHELNQSEENILPFDKWVRLVDSCMQPIKGEMIWVKDKGDKEWTKRKFSHLEGEIAMCYLLDNNDESSKTLYVDWDEYSVTDPNL